MNRTKFTDEQRIEMVTLGLQQAPVELICERLECKPYSIYQARRSDWYQLLKMALRPFVKGTISLTPEETQAWAENELGNTPTHVSA